MEVIGRSLLERGGGVRDSPHWMSARATAARVSAPSLRFRAFPFVQITEVNLQRLVVVQLPLACAPSHEIECGTASMDSTLMLDSIGREEEHEGSDTSYDLQLVSRLI
jgi:hypothetical protein